MALNSVSSEEFSFPSLASHDSSSHRSGLDSPPLWKHSPVHSSRRKDYDFEFARLVIGKEGDLHDQAKSFSYVEMRRRWSEDKAEDKMDMLWEDLNEDLPPRSQSLRIETGGDGGEKKTSFFTDENSAVAVGCGTGMKLSKNTPKKKKKNLNVLVLMRVLKKLIVLRSSSHRSPVKTHPR
ncbi:hypothetical protein CARUB_v10021023mg [Capsella rubella]|uniref:Uncharacterized protein n=1 Tax=Capsella rubella TaxID=81985 RepID=R0GJ67_9BRAS|nr:uncharacterized protein LOC17894730 [Capsella rubella]EOA35791.1 hypothetical protein CARUB_v10021023mg [Capsella rubella]